MKKFMIVFMGLILISGLAHSKPLTKKQEQQLSGHKSLRDQMGKMILSIADLDFIINRDKTTDFNIFKEDAERILTSIGEIRKLDKNKVYEPFLLDLEKPTKELLNYSIQKDARASKYAEDIFNACFKCHKEHRKY